MVQRNSPAAARTFVVLTVLVFAGLGTSMISQKTAVPSLAAGVILMGLATLKARFLILDYLDMRARSGALKTAILAWPLLFAMLALLRIILSGVFSG